jgi:hypothetical protein
VKQKRHQIGRKCKPLCDLCGYEEMGARIAKEPIIIKEVKRLSSLPAKKLWVELKKKDSLWLMTLGMSRGGLELRNKILKYKQEVL